MPERLTDHSITTCHNSVTEADWLVVGIGRNRSLLKPRQSMLAPHNVTELWVEL